MLRVQRRRMEAVERRREGRDEKCHSSDALGRCRRVRRRGERRRRRGQGATERLRQH
jgi:hypothetical protein